MSRRNKIILVTGSLVIFLCFAGFIIFQSYFVRAVRVPTGAMANTIVPGDCLYARRLFGEVKRGDIIIFAYPGEPSTRYVSRVVGLPGESIQVKGTSIIVNAQPIPEQRVLVEPPGDYQFDAL